MIKSDSLLVSARRVSVPDDCLSALDAYFPPTSKREALLTVTDIAGLVNGASKGAGLGNSFLSTISTVDGINHPVVTSQSIEALLMTRLVAQAARKGKVDNHKVLSHQPERVEHSYGRRSLKEILVGLLNEVKPIKSRSWSENQIEAINGTGLLAAEPIAFLLNVSEENCM